MLSLIKELASIEQPMNEASGTDHLKLFSTICHRIEDHMEYVSRMLRQDSRLSHLVDQLGGDKANFDKAVKLFEELERAVHDLHMYTDISARNQEE